MRVSSCDHNSWGTLPPPIWSRMTLRKLKRLQFLCLSKTSIISCPTSEGWMEMFAILLWFILLVISDRWVIGIFIAWAGGDFNNYLMPPVSKNLSLPHSKITEVSCVMFLVHPNHKIVQNKPTKWKQQVLHRNGQELYFLPSHHTLFQIADGCNCWTVWVMHVSALSSWSVIRGIEAWPFQSTVSGVV